MREREGKMELMRTELSGMNNRRCIGMRNKKISYNFSCPISFRRTVVFVFTNYAKYLCWFWPYAFCLHLFANSCNVCVCVCCSFGHYFAGAHRMLQHVQINFCYIRPFSLSQNIILLFCWIRTLLHRSLTLSVCHQPKKKEWKKGRLEKASPPTISVKRSQFLITQMKMALKWNRRNVHNQHEHIHLPCQCTKNKMKNLRWW